MTYFKKMKANHNDIKIKSLRNIQKPNNHKNSNIPSPNYPRMVSPILKPNKTIQKYINEKLNSLKTIRNNIKKESINSKNQQRCSLRNSNILIKNKLIISPIRKNNKKPIEIIKKQKKINAKKKEKNESKTNNIENINIEKQVFYSKKQNIQESKLFNSTATSSVGLYSNENRTKFSNKEKNNNSNIIYNYNSNKKINANALEKANVDNPRINNFNYESGNDDNFSEKKIYLKYDNSSLLTFGNSFSYSNSKRTKSNKKEGCDENKNYVKEKSINYNIKKNIYVNKLKEENETLKRELKESSEQINYLIYQIKELKQNKIVNYHSKNFIRNKKVCSPNIWKNRFMKNYILEKDNFKSSNNDIHKLMDKSDYLLNQENAKNKFNKDLLKDINKSINDKNYRNCRKKILIKRKIKLNKKENNKTKNNSISSIDKTGDNNISECISKLII